MVCFLHCRSPNNQQLWQYGFFNISEKQSHCHSISIAMAQNVHDSVCSEKMRLLSFVLLVANGPFGRHGSWWRIACRNSLGNVPSWKRARSVGLSSVRSNSWTTDPRGAGSAAVCFVFRRWYAGGATSTSAPLIFPGLPSEVSSSPTLDCACAATTLSSRRFIFLTFFAVLEA